jgi:hypothetical protein
LRASWYRPSQFVERLRITELAQRLEHGRAADPERVDQLRRAVAVALGQALNDQTLAVAPEQEVGGDIGLRPSVGLCVCS